MIIARFPHYENKELMMQYIEGQLLVGVITDGVTDCTSTAGQSWDFMCHLPDLLHNN